MVASNVAEAREMLSAESFALVMSDVNMPGESGIELIKSVVNDHPDTATVMCTGVDDTKIAGTALEIGAYGYIVKPFEPNEILIAVMNALRRRSLEIENRNHREHLEQMVKDRTGDLWEAVSDLERAEKEIRLSREETVQRLSMAAEFRDQETAAHIKRMSLYCALLAEKLGEEPQRCESIRLSSVMHDVGKIGIPDNILLKPGPLDPEEWKIMKTHSEIGYRILSNSRSHLLAEAAEIALTHHERIDGSGYPRGLVEDEIPLEGKIAAVADVFDALTTNRVYRKAFALGEAVDIMKEGRGDKYDPKILDMFLSSLDRVLGIKEMHRDSTTLLGGN
jgi:putative two-component system response regulator